jgi:hypothetical protein
VAVSREQALKHSKLASPQASSPLSRSFRYTVDAEKRLVAVSFGKKLTVQQIKRYSDLLQMNPSFQPTYSEIVDLTQVEEHAQGFAHAAKHRDFPLHGRSGMLDRNQFLD